MFILFTNNTPPEEEEKEQEKYIYIYTCWNNAYIVCIVQMYIHVAYTYIIRMWCQTSWILHRFLSNRKFFMHSGDVRSRSPSNSLPESSSDSPGVVMRTWVHPSEFLSRISCSWDVMDAQPRKLSCRGLEISYSVFSDKSNGLRLAASD
jgi:hypothetical protein